MQQGADLVSAGQPTINVTTALLGGLSNATQQNIPAATNLSWGAGGLSDSAIAASGVMNVVAVPVSPGTTVTRVSVLAGATAEATGTNLFVALYAGTGAAPVLLGSSVSNTGATAVGAQAMFTGTLSAPVTISNLNAPYGYVYAGIMVAAGTMPTLVSTSTPVAVQYPWTTTAPIFLSASFGTGLTNAAPASITGATDRAQAPVMILT